MSELPPIISGYRTIEAQERFHDGEQFLRSYHFGGRRAGRTDAMMDWLFEMARAGRDVTVVEPNVVEGTAVEITERPELES